MQREGLIKKNSKKIPKRAALLLNSSFEAMKVISWQKAMILWMSEKVEVLEFHDLYIHTMKTKYPIPSVIRLKTYISMSNYRRVRFSKQNVYLRDSGICQYCGKKCSNKELTIDHVIPISKQGPETWGNVVAACRSCNQKKGNRTPSAAGMPLLREPESPHWMTTIELELKNSKMPQSWQHYIFPSSILKSG